ncbi:methionine--tRNA ligase [bacterium]|nr:methionine--tRNA ligase [bacterium]MBU4133928.1 methionine--tRNA ligase [bacterium]
MREKIYYITTPIYYANAPLHIGHAYSTVAADTAKRWQALKGRETFMLTGMDEHGEKIYRSAEKSGVKPEEWVDRGAAAAKELWSFMNISYDGFVRTTDNFHKKAVEEVFKKLLAQGDIYSADYQGPYCVSCETFFTEQQVKDANGNCPDCGKKINEIKAESALFFRLSSYGEKLLNFYKANPDFLKPSELANKTIDTVTRGLKDLCVTREKVTWGISVPGDPSKTIYVWFDALVNYLSGAGFPHDMERFGKLWPADCHIVGKEIYYFHTVIFPALLMALDLPLPKKVYGHGWWTLKNDKMSKSTGNIVTPYEVCKHFEPDILRFFFLREMPFGADGAFSIDRIEERYAADLANPLGNLFKRTEVMLSKYFGGKTPSDGSFDAEIFKKQTEALQKFSSFMDELQFHSALNALWELVDAANRFIEEKKPWVLFKEKSPRLNDVMLTLEGCLEFITGILSPFMPVKCAEMASHIAAEIKLPEPGAFRKGQVIPGGEILFPALDIIRSGETQNSD